MAKNTKKSVETLVARLTQWRSAPGSERKIPDELWQEAGDLAATYGVGVVARATGLNYSQVKARMRGVPDPDGDRSVAFKKRMTTPSKMLSPFVHVPMNIPTICGKPMVVEMRNARGDFMRIEQASGSELQMVIGAFYGGQS